MRAPGGLGGLLARGSPGDGLVEGHEDIRAQPLLRLHRFLRGHEVLGAVDMRFERQPLFAHLMQRGEAENLVPAAVGEDAAVPRLEAVQPAQAVR